MSVLRGYLGVFSVTQHVGIARRFSKHSKVEKRKLSEFG